MHNARIPIILVAVWSGFIANMILAGPASAHTASYNAAATTLTIKANQVQLQSDLPRRATGNPPINGAKLFYQQYFAQNFTVADRHGPCSFVLTSFTFRPQDLLSVTGEFNCSQPIDRIEDLSIHNTISAPPAADFTHFVIVESPMASWSLAFTPGHHVYPGDTSAYMEGSYNPASWLLPVFSQFISLGIYHILTGFDHILFLISVILLLRSWKKLLVIVTTFTVAHSVTLILAGLHLVTIPSRLVEPLIAFSVVVMALRNVRLLQTRRPDQGHDRIIATAGFGLVHGLGFATALTSTAVPSGYVVPALLVFNVGVEIGQLSLLLALVPVLHVIDKLKFRRPIYLGLSVAIALVATLWLIERLV